jgi:hypothetical protein
MPEVVQQRLWAGECVWDFVLANVLVFALPSPIVIAQHTSPTHEEIEGLRVN